MKLSEILDSLKKKSEAGLSEIHELPAGPFFRSRGQAPWNGKQREIVVVGSGIGGMASGALFAKQGHNVTILEMNPGHIGGHGRCYSFNSLPYSMGPQYVWEFGDGMLGDRFLRYLGLKDTTPFVPMAADGFERIIICGQNTGNHYRIDFKVPLGLDNFRHALNRFFPEEKEKIDPLFDDMIAVFQTYKAHFRRHVDTEGRFLLATKFLLTGKIPMEMKLKLGRTIYYSVKELFDQYGISNLLRRILYGHGGIFAENESEMSAIAYIIGTGNYHEGAWYPRKGFAHFFSALADVISSNGGTVQTGKKVIQLETRENTVVSAACADGSIYRCDYLFSDISPRLTGKLLDNHSEQFDYSPSHSIPTCCIGLKKGLPGIAKMKGRNYWWQDGTEVNYHQADMSAPPQMLFIASPSANGFGPTGDAADDGLVIFCPGNYESEKSIYLKGAAAVDDFKKQLTDNILSILDRHVFPGIHSRVRFTRLFSSVDIENDTAAELGNAYGRRLTAAEILKGPIREENNPANLFNVSATKNSPGIAGGIFTAGLIFKELTGLTI